MGEIRDKLAGTARESVEGSIYSSTSAPGFEEIPSVPRADPRGSIKAAEDYASGTPKGCNVSWGRNRKG